MTVPGRHGRRIFPVILWLLLELPSGAAVAQLAAGENATTTLARADATKTSDHDSFLATIQRLRRDASALNQKQQAHLRYLEAWQVAYAGEYETATPMLERITADSTDKTLRFRATATLVNILGIGHRYEEAFSRLTELTDDLPGVTDPGARMQGLGEAAQMLTMAGQYDLAADYAERMIQNAPAAGSSVCKGTYIKLHALYRGKRIGGKDPRFAQGITDCTTAGETLFANALRADMADDAIEQGRPRDALDMLEKNYADVLGYHYPNLTSEFEALLARASLQAGNIDAAEKYAQAAVKTSIVGEYSAPLGMALQTLYMVAKAHSDFRGAASWLERYMKADKGYLDDVTTRTMAYQVVRQQVISNRLETDALDRQNQILHLQREIDRRSMETSRLYILLLLVVLATIGLWLVRTKRSQLRFMHMARRDSLTGICNRQHFVEKAGEILRLARKSGKPACLILFDLDHFKLVNDTYGHSEGDWVLLRVVAECRDHLLEEDVFGRLGGEEFAILLPNVDEPAGAKRAEMIRMAIAAAPAGGPTTARVTASFGVACARRDEYDLDRMLVRADEALYSAKGSGRDRVVVARDDEPSPAPDPTTGEGGVGVDAVLPN